MFIFTAISGLVTGAMMGICLRSFHQNGWIPKKYLESENPEAIPSRTESHISTPIVSPHKKGKRMHKAFAF